MKAHIESKVHLIFAGFRPKLRNVVNVVPLPTIQNGAKEWIAGLVSFYQMLKISNFSFLRRLLFRIEFTSKMASAIHQH